MDITEILDRKQPRRRPVTIVLDADIELELAEAEDAVNIARNRGVGAPKGLPNLALTAAEAELEAVQERARAVSATFLFQSIGREAYEQLRDEYPPTKAQRDEFRKMWLRQGAEAHQIPELSYNTDTFPPVLFAASCLDPVMDVEQATALWTSAGWSDSELGQLLTAALDVNERSRRHDLGNG